MLFLLILLLPLFSFSRVYILYNHPLPDNNFEIVIREDNYRYMVETIKNIEGIRDVYLMEEEEDVYLYIERYPILKEVSIRGNFTIWRDDILSYLGFYEGMPFKDVKPEDIKERVLRLYRDRGMLDASIGVTLYTDEEGYVHLYIGVDEGLAYFTDSGVYKGSSYPSEKLDEVAGIVVGRLVNEGAMLDRVFLLQDFYIKEGYLDSFVYFEGLEKVKLRKPFWKVLMPMDLSVRKRPLRILGSLSEGLSNIFRHPLSTFTALTGRAKVAKPIFHILEGQRYEFIFEGGDLFRKDELIEISGLRGKGIDPFSLEEARENLIKAYHRKGFFDAVVGYRLEENKVVFVINQGERYLALQEDGWRGFYDEDELEAELRRRIKSLERLGYTLATGNIKKELDRDKKTVQISFDINRNKKQILKSLVYNGENKEVSKIFRKHQEKLPAIYNTELIEKLNLDIKGYFAKRGFMEGDFSIEVKIEEDEENLYYTYLYIIDEGPRYKLGETIYYGYKHTNRRELSYMTERAQDYSEELDSKTLYSMLNSGMFTGVSIETFLDKDKKMVHRLIQLLEDKRGFFDLSLGYNTQDKLSLEAFLGAKNLFGVGLATGLRYRRSSKGEFYNLELSDSFLFSRRYWMRSEIFRTFEDHLGYDLRSEGLSIQLGYRLSPFTSVGPVFNLSKNSFDSRALDLKKYGLFLLREYKDDPFYPSRIHYNSVVLTLAQGDAKYTKFDLSTFYLIPLRRDYKLSFKVAGGYVSKKAPIFDRFFLGGLKNLRGYSFESVGQPHGGRYYTFGRLELIFPLREPFLGVLFADVGNVSDSLKNLRKDIKSNAGVAFGVNTPIGPIRLDVAVPVEREGLKRYKLYLSVGYY
jgi:outer membrane protein insertion porin family